MRRPPAVFGYCLLAAISAAPAADFPWKAKFTEASSPALMETHESLLASRPEALRAYPAAGQVWSGEDFELKMDSGKLYLEPAVEGTVVGAFFEGTATITFSPRTVTAQTGLKMNLNRTSLEKLPVKTAYLFSLRPDSLMTRLAASGAGDLRPPEQATTYAADKSAMRQLGLEMVSLFLNRSGPAKGAAYVLFPMEEIRTARSEEARLLYAMNPMVDESIRLGVFGHEEMTAVKPYKFRFYEICSYASRDTGSDGVTLERSRVKISLGRTPKSAVEEATLSIKRAPGVSALILSLTVNLQVSEVKGPDGATLQFLQWEKLLNDPDFDQTVLVALGGAGTGGEGGREEVTISSSGILFEPAGSTFYLVDEDDWFPHFISSKDAHRELDLTIPKEYAGIGVGDDVLEEGKGTLKRIVYRTTQPTKNSTFYYGDYTKTEGMADDIKVELYQDRASVMEQKNARFTLTEITNALKVFSRIFVPLDIKSLRAASTLTEHGRGFEGLLLLGAGGTGTASESWADLFRAHEVAHQWWGQYVRPKYAREDRWLSEAFAEYSAMEYYKARFEDRKKAVEVMTREWVLPLTEGNTTRQSLTGTKETFTGGTFYPIAAGTDNVYTKGPMVINMLRYVFNVQKGNDEAFFPMLKDFLQTYRYKEASTADFKRVAEKHIGVNLDWFFDQWIEDGGLPLLKWSYEVAEGEGGWVVKLQARQEQKNYRLVVPVYMHFPGDKLAVRPWMIEGESGTKTFKLPSKPTDVTLNDNLEALLILKKM